MLSILKPKRVTSRDGNVYVITVYPSPLLGDPNTSSSVVLTPEQFERYTEWTNDNLLMIQDALYDLSADDREILLTGLGPAQFDEIVGSDE